MKLTSVLVLSSILLISTIQALNVKESGLSEFFKRSEQSEEDWTDITTGLMMQASEESNVKLASRDTTSSKRERSEILMERDLETGNLILPRSWKDVKGLMRRHLGGYISTHVKQGRKTFSKGIKVIITWYTGHDLLNPSCVSSSGWAPTDDSMVGAVTIAWSTKPACGKFVKIRHASDKSKTITIRIMDSCGGCAPGTPHIDLTQGAFTKLYDLDVGLVSGLQATIVSAPVGYTWTDEDVALYGPSKL